MASLLRPGLESGQFGHIKEQRLDLFAGRPSCHRFLANKFRLLSSSAAYVPVSASGGFRRIELAGGELSAAQVGTLRLKFFKFAARVVLSARPVVFHPTCGYPHQKSFRAVFDRLASGRMRVAAETG